MTTDLRATMRRRLLLTYRVEPGVTHSASSAFFDGLPGGSARFDSALVMIDLPVRWRHDVSAARALTYSAESHESHRFTAVAPAP